MKKKDRLAKLTSIKQELAKFIGTLTSEDDTETHEFSIAYSVNAYMAELMAGEFVE